MSARPPRLLRGLRRRLSSSLAAEEELEWVRAQLTAERAAHAREALLFVAHRSAWDRERHRLCAEPPTVRVDTSEAERALLRVKDNLIDLDERRAR